MSNNDASDSKVTSKEEDIAQQGLSKLVRIVLDAREDVFIFGTEDMKAIVDEFEDRFPEENIRRCLKEDLKINKAGVIIGFNLRPPEPEQKTFFVAYRHVLSLSIFVNQLSLRGIMDKLDLGKVSNGMKNVIEGMMKLRARKGGIVSSKESQVQHRKGKGRGPTYGGV